MHCGSVSACVVVLAAAHAWPSSVSVVWQKKEKWQGAETICRAVKVSTNFIMIIYFLFDTSLRHSYVCSVNKSSPGRHGFVCMITQLAAWQCPNAKDVHMFFIVYKTSRRSLSRGDLAKHVAIQYYTWEGVLGPSSWYVLIVQLLESACLSP